MEGFFALFQVPSVSVEKRRNSAVVRRIPVREEDAFGLENEASG